MDELTGLKPKEEDSMSVPTSVPYDSDEADSISLEAQKYSFDLSSVRNEKTVTLPVGSLPSCRVPEKKDSDYGEERSKSGGIPVSKRCHQRSYSDTYFKNKSNSSDNTSYDGNSEGDH